MRKASVERNTSETKIKVDLNLDGTGKSNIDTGIFIATNSFFGIAAII